MGKYWIVGAVLMVAVLAGIMITTHKTDAAKPEPFLEVELTYPDCHHRTSSVRWNHPTLTHTVEHIFQVKNTSGVWAIGDIINEPVGGRIRSRGTSEVTRHQRIRTGQEFRMLIRLKDENGTRFFSTGGVSPPVTIGPCPGH